MKAQTGTVGALPEFVDEVKRAYAKLEAVLIHPSNAVRRDRWTPDYEGDFEMRDLRVMHQALLRFVDAFEHPMDADDQGARVGTEGRVTS